LKQGNRNYPIRRKGGVGVFPTGDVGGKSPMRKTRQEDFSRQRYRPIFDMAKEIDEFFPHPRNAGRPLTGAPEDW
jgi:hypothetical protein